MEKRILKENFGDRILEEAKKDRNRHAQYNTKTFFHLVRRDIYSTLKIIIFNLGKRNFFIFCSQNYASTSKMTTKL